MKWGGKTYLKSITLRSFGCVQIGMNKSSDLVTSPLNLFVYYGQTMPYIKKLVFFIYHEKKQNKQKKTCKGVKSNMSIMNIMVSADLSMTQIIRGMWNDISTILPCWLSYWRKMHLLCLAPELKRQKKKFQVQLQSISARLTCWCCCILLRVTSACHQA